MKVKSTGRGLPRKCSHFELPLHAAPILGFVAVCCLWMMVVFQSRTLSDSTGQLFRESMDAQTVSTLSKMKIPTPVFVPSLPKSGTTSIWKFFSCGLGKGQAAHHFGNVETNNGTQLVRLGKCFRANVKKKRPFLEGCGDYQVWTDAGFIAPGACYYPSVHGGLQALYESHPRATILHIVRDTQAWVNSTSKFNDLQTRWSERCTSFPPKGSQREDYVAFYTWHTEMVRQFANLHPTMTFIELPLEGDDTGVLLEKATGINASCWVHSRTKQEGVRPHRFKKLQKETSQSQANNATR